MTVLVVRGACEHNLQNVDVELSHGTLVVFSGVSGSGKTSLAFDTIYAEARRRYWMTVARTGQGQALKAPRVRRLDGLSPAVAIGQARPRHNPRVTVATLAGLHDYLRLLFARLGVPHCLVCGTQVRSQSFEEVYEQAAGLPAGTGLLVLAPRWLGKGGDPGLLLAEIDRAGYRRLRLDGRIVLLEEVEPRELVGRIEIVVDRLVVKADTTRRLKGSLQAALEIGQGHIGLVYLEREREAFFAVRPSCPSCQTPFPAQTPALFSFNSVHGACPQCRGLGTQSGLDFDQMWAGGQANVEDALGALWRDFGHRELRDRVYRFCQRHKIDPEQPIGEWSEEAAARLWDGGGRRGAFKGVGPWAQERRQKAEGEELAWLEERLGDTPCPACQGSRLLPEARAVEIDGHTLDQILALSIAEGASLLGQIRFSGPRATAGDSIRARLLQILERLADLGLPYLQLGRRADSLSSGEWQRLRLGAVLGASMTQVLYVLDEPSAGLHPRDVDRLLGAVESLRDGGNTVLVVEHDAAVLRRADTVVDMGPGAGVAGGRIVAVGNPREVAGSPGPTGRHLRGEISVGKSRGRPAAGWLELVGASGHNLQRLTVRFPLGNLVCVTGVSGSGKSTLVNDTLKPLLAAHLQGARHRPLDYISCDGLEQLERVVGVDQRPIGLTPRSNAATYTGLLAPIRQLFAERPEARLRAYRPAHFSFNAPQGACGACGGRGSRSLRQAWREEMEAVCGSCSGRRYKAEVLEIRYRGLNLAEVLDLSVAQALEIFAAVPEAARRLQVMDDVGLGYLRLGQPASSFSGGEAQRIKLAAELSRPQRAHTLYMLDEPTIGLHLEDVRLLVNLLQRLVDQDNSVIVVEHQIELIAAADYVIDLGPEGGEGGGRVVATGPPAAIADEEKSWTGRFLRPYLQGGD